MYSNIFVQFGLSLVMIYIAFSPTNLKQSFKYLVIFYLTTFVFGGCAFALLYYIKPQEILYKNGMLKGTYPIKVAILGGMVGLIIVNIAFKLIKNRISKNDMFCDVKIGYRGKVTTVRAIIDSGNMLKEPITGFSVIVVESKKLEELLDKDILNNLQEIISGNYGNISEEYISKFRLIPFSSLGKQNGMLLGFKPDWITVKFDESERKLSKIIIRHLW